MAIAGISATRAFGTVYYVSPTGSDTNSGTSPLAPWGSVAKVDGTSFQPGDQILFQYGSNWDASLDATSSGTTSAPIVYGAYGNPSLGNPTFYGSNPISNSAFSTYSGTTFLTTSATPVNCVYINHSFLSEAQDLLTVQNASNPTSPAADLSAVESTPYTFYYNSDNGQLFVNAGTGLTNQYITLGFRQDAIYNNYQSNLIFRNLNAAETAADNQGYGIRVENGSNVTILNSTVTNAGKHSVGVIDSTGVAVTNVVANFNQPQLGFGGASAFVSYADSVTGPLSVNDTSVYTNDSYTNPNGPYAAFISHGGPNGGIASIALNNMTSVSPVGAGSAIYNTSPSEVVTISGGTFAGGTELDTNNSIINGATFTGPYATVELNGTHTVVQNSTFNGPLSGYGGNQFGAVLDSGTNNTIRFNVVNEPSSAPGLSIGNPNTSTNIYGNIITSTQNPQNAMGIGLVNFINAQLNSNYNVFLPNMQFLEADPSTPISAAQWQSMGYDLNSLFTGATFNNSSAGDFSLQNGSAGMGLVPASELDPTLTIANSLLGSPSSNGNYNAGLNPYLSTTLTTLANSVVLNNASVMQVIAPTSNLLTIQSTGSIMLLSSASLDLACNVNSSGTVVLTGSLIQTGNFNNSGSFYVSGSQLWSPGTVFTNLAGNAVFASDAGGTIAPVGYLSINASGGSVVFASSQHLAGLTILSGATVQVSQQSAGTQSIIYTPSLTITGTLDLTDNDLIAQGGSLAAVTALVKLGYNGGKWTGNGITSTTAAADTSHLTAVGVILNNVDGIDPLYGTASASAVNLGLFDGASPNPEDVLVKYTYYGDANLDGKVDGSDYSLIDNGYVEHLTGWYNGDFNYDGTVDGSDYTLIDNAFNNQGASLENAVSTAQIAVVPEPAGTLLSLTAITVLSRRRRNHMR